MYLATQNKNITRFIVKRLIITNNIISRNSKNEIKYNNLFNFSQLEFVQQINCSNVVINYN